MEVTKENFEKLLPEVIEDISSCSFMSVDLELTGLWQKNEPKQLDMPEEYYYKFIANASDFLCIQFGLTTFKMNSQTKRYAVKTYNFNVFPHQFNSNSQYSFLCQASAIDFLTSHNFDFNRTFYKGIQYMNIEKEAKLSEILKERRYYKEKNASKEIEKIEIPDDLKDSVKEACDKLGTVLDNDLSEDEVKVSGLNGYIRRLVYQTIKERYPNGELFVETRNNCLVGRKAKSEKDQKTPEELDEETIDKAVGFSKVIKAIAKSGKLVVGHNMFLDLCHMINHFLCNLPENYAEFKSLLRGSFPLLIDTKFMSSCPGMQNLISVTILERLYERISEEPFKFPEIDFENGYSYGVDMKYHDAGFDSCVTGIVFIGLYNYIVKTKNSKGNPDFSPKSDKLKNILNRIFLHFTPDCYMHLSGDDPLPNRDHYFQVTFPKEWVTSDIIRLFHNHGRTIVNWINDTSAWVCLCNPSNADACRSELCSKSSFLPRGVKVIPYGEVAYCSTTVSRKRDAGLADSPHPKRHKSFQEANTPKRSLSNVPNENEKNDKGNEGNCVLIRKSQDSAISELEKEMDADTSVKSLFGSSSW